MASWWQDIDQFFGDFFAFMRQASMSSPFNQLDHDPSMDAILDFITDGPPAPSYSASEEQVKQWEYMFSHLPGYGDWLRARDNFNWMSDYLKNNNMSWSDMLYPSKASGSGAGSDMINFTSRNIEKLYKNH